MLFLDGFIFFFFFQSYSMVADFVALVIFEVCHIIFLVEKMFAGAVGIFYWDCTVVCGSKVSSFQLKVWNFLGREILFIFKVTPYGSWENFWKGKEHGAWDTLLQWIFQHFPNFFVLLNFFFIVWTYILFLLFWL